jgi:hypothetical protein
MFFSRSIVKPFSLRLSISLPAKAAVRRPQNSAGMAEI